MERQRKASRALLGAWDFGRLFACVHTFKSLPASLEKLGFGGSKEIPSVAHLIRESLSTGDAQRAKNKVKDTQGAPSAF